MSSVRRIDCRLCGSQEFTEVLSLVPTPPANALLRADQCDVEEPVYPLDVFQCTACGHVQLRDVVDADSLFRHYLYVSGTSPVFRQHLESLAEWAVERFALAPNSLVVEFGSNDGTLLEAFRRRKMKVLGVEPATNLAEQAVAAGLDTLPEFFTSRLARGIRERYGNARLVAANNVFAHADDLSDITRGVRELLAPDGVFVFEVSYLLDVFEKTLFDTIYHEHLSYHSVGPLRAFFANHGMHLFDVQRVEPQGGSIRCMVQLENGPYPHCDSVDELVSLERKAGLDRPDGMLGYAVRLQERKTELTELLTRLKAEGKRIAAFGAPAKATTLLHYFGLAGDIIEYIVEDNPLKQGLFTPGLHIPIVTPQHLYDEKPDFVVVLAWNFAASIIERHREFHEAGGRFIVPLPTVEVL